LGEHIGIQFEPAAEGQWVDADPSMLEQVLMNLCVNARDAMPGGGRITLSAENLELDKHYAAMNPEAQPGPYVLLRVKDTGTGMPPEVLEKIFEPFFTTKEVGKGTGLGLSTVMAIVRSHSGFVRVDSEPGKGTEFKIYLPANAGAQAAGAPEGRRSVAGGRGELVMIVDDERVIREITRAALEDHGYRVVDAEDGTGALARYARHAGEIRAVVLDMIMPYLDGPSTIRALLKMDPDVRIIGVSGLTETVTAAEKVAGKQIPFLPKPYTTEQLLEMLDRILHEEDPQSVTSDSGVGVQ
jgi:CheY-like chemotaxis protein